MKKEMADSNPIIWVPSTKELKNSPLVKYRDLVNEKHELSLKSYGDIHACSVNPKTAGDFWMAVFDFLDIGAYKLPSRVFGSVSSKVIWISYDKAKYQFELTYAQPSGKMFSIPTFSPVL